MNQETLVCSGRRNSPEQIEVRNRRCARGECPLFSDRVGVHHGAVVAVDAAPEIRQCDIDSDRSLLYRHAQMAGAIEYQAAGTAELQRLGVVAHAVLGRLRHQLKDDAVLLLPGAPYSPFRQACSPRILTQTILSAIRLRG